MNSCLKNTANCWKSNAGDVPVEVKYSLFSENKTTRSYMNYIDNFKPKYGIMLTKNYWGVEKVKGTTVLFAPVYYL